MRQSMSNNFKTLTVILIVLLFSPIVARGIDRPNVIVILTDDQGW